MQGYLSGYRELFLINTTGTSRSQLLEDSNAKLRSFLKTSKLTMVRNFARTWRATSSMDSSTRHLNTAHDQFFILTSSGSGSWSALSLTMSTAEQSKYMWIPPPPLPEFYLPKDKLEKLRRSDRSSTSSSSGIEADKNTPDEQGEAVKVSIEKEKVKEEKAKEQQPALSGDGVYDGLPPRNRYCCAPPPPPAPTGDSIPLLAVYHICRTCLRPRSGKYHREHPIPVNGVPPPPGICHRCRVTTVTGNSEASELDVSDVDEVVKKGRSHEIKLGLIAPFVPDEAMISNGKAKRMNAQRYLRGRSGERHITVFREASSEAQRRNRECKSQRSNVVYRHVNVVEQPEPRSGASRKVETQDRPMERSRERDLRIHYERTAEQTVEGRANGKGVSSPRGQSSLKSANLARLDSTKASKVPQGPRSSSASGSVTTQEVKPNTVYLKRPDRKDSEIRKIAGEEARRYATTAKANVRPESEIRRIAHEEVQRYREAERKLEARPRAFAHGRVVPVRPRNDLEPEEAQQHPRQDVTKNDHFISQARNASCKAEPADSTKSSSTFKYCQNPSKSEGKSTGPQWRRELSSERCRSSETGEARWRIDEAEETRSRVSAVPSVLSRGDKSRSAYDVVPDANVSARATKATSSQNEAHQSPRPRQQAEHANMGLLFPPVRSHEQRHGSDRERKTVERLRVHRRPSSSSGQGKASPAVRNPSKTNSSAHKFGLERSAVSQPSSRWQTSGSGGTPSSSGLSSSKSWERGSEEHTEFLAETRRTQKATEASLKIIPERNADRPVSDVQYEYKLHTVRPANRPGDLNVRDKGSPRRSSSPSHVTLEIWQQVPIDPVQRAREVPMQEKERQDAVEWLKTRMNDPKAQVGIDPDGSRRLACSIPHRRSDDQRPPSSAQSQQSSQRHADWRRERSPRNGILQTPQRSVPRHVSDDRRARPSHRSQHSNSRHADSGQEKSPYKEILPIPRRSKEPRGDGGNDKDTDPPDREIVVEVWEQVPVEEAARRRREAAEARARGEDPEKGYVVEAWKQVPSSRPSAGNARRDSAMEMPPARRRRERREHQRASGDSAHVKFASKVDISPTPPGSEDSSNAFRRFHDFMGRKSACQQIDGHDSEERGEDLIAEYERRGRLRSREPARRKSDKVYEGLRVARDRDETIRPEGRYDGMRDEAWRPLQRALSESPSREWADRKTSFLKGGPPHHPDRRPLGSMTTHDGSRSSGQRG